MNLPITMIERRRSRATDPATSHAAARNAERFANSHAGRILAALKERELNAQEIAAATGLSVEQVCRRLPEADTFSVVVKDGQPLERNGYRVWRLND